MRLLSRALAATAAALTLSALAVAPAAASPEDGKGCVGLPSVPAAYVCVVSLTPTNALPTVTTTNIPVTVPRVCYYVDCTPATTVQVPVPGYTPGSGYVAVLYWNGQYFPISVPNGIDFDQPLCQEVNEILARWGIALNCRILDVIWPYPYIVEAP